MLHSDQLAAEFAEILNANEIFAPLLPLDPAVTFYAPLRNNVTDLRGNPATFARASEAYYKDASGVYRKSLADSPRFEQSRLLMEPAKTNICENYNAAPDAALTGVFLGGVGTLQRVEDGAALAAAGLSEINNGFAIEIISDGGTANANVDGDVPAPSVYAASAWIKKIGTTGNVYLRFSSTASVEVTNQEYERIEIVGDAEVSDRLQVGCSGGATARFVLNQLEESSVATSPIVTEGTAGQRDADLLDYGVPVFLENAEGMLVFDVYPLFSPAEFEDVGIQAVIATDPNARFLDHWVPNVTTFNWRFRDDQPNTAQVIATVIYQRNDRLRVATRWKTGLDMQIGLKTRDGNYEWSPPVNYSGAFPKQFFRLWNAPLIPSRMNELYLYDEDRGTVYIEANH